MGAKKLKAKPAPVEEAPRTFWEINGDKKKNLLAYLISGMSKKRAAQHVGVSRDTVHEWCKDPNFAAKLAEELGDHAQSVRIRRVRQESLFADKAAAQVNAAMERAARGGEGAKEAIIRVERWGDQFRKWRAEERIDLGDNVSRKEISFQGQLGVTQQSTHHISLKKVFEQKLEIGIVKAEQIQAIDVGEVVSDVLVQLLSGDPTIVDLVAEEDRAMLEGAKK